MQSRLDMLQEELRASDADLIRFAEDLLILLIQKEITCYAEIHVTIHQCVFIRRRLRYELRKLLLHDALAKDFEA